MHNLSLLLLLRSRKKYDNPFRLKGVPKKYTYTHTLKKQQLTHSIFTLLSSKLIVNPAFAKRSVDDNQLSFKEKLKLKIDRKKMHESQMNRDYLKAENMDKDAIEFHRSNRLELYQKLETLFTGWVLFYVYKDYKMQISCITREFTAIIWNIHK